MPKNHFDHKAQAKRNREEARSSKKPKPKRHVSYDSEMRFLFGHAKEVWKKDERRRLRLHKHGWR